MSKPKKMNPKTVPCASDEGTSSDENQILTAEELGVLEPHARIKALAESAYSVEVDCSIPPRRYFRSGHEMVKMANVYLKEGSMENAYILYLKFMTLFLEKIRKHPGYTSVPVEDIEQNKLKLREVLPKAEKLKEKLLKLYQHEYAGFIQQRKKQLEEEARRKKETEELERKEREANISKIITTSTVINKPCEPLTLDIEYPTDLLVPKAPSKPLIDRSTKPSMLMSTSLQVQMGLRDIIIPSKLMAKFLILSIHNTEKNVETCGILAGTMERNQLYITHLLIPKQTGTSDSCTASNEEEIFAYQDKNDLITLGWIHTHPSQTAFLSSVDLHTHCSYQLMMPESIAIVCSPKYDENCFFQLTDYGLEFVSSCRQAGFHSHPTEPPLFTHAVHAKLEDKTVEVVDLRTR